jgi:hypothetical protein
VRGQPITFGLQVLIDPLEPKLSLEEAKWSLIVPWGELYVVKTDGQSSIQKIIMLIPYRLIGAFPSII